MKIVEEEKIENPGLVKGDGLYVQLVDLMAELLVEQNGPSFNAVTASANDKEIRY